MVKARSELSEKVFAALDENSSLGPKELSQRFNCPMGTASSIKNKWKRARKIPTGSKAHPVRTTKPTPEPIKEEEKALPTPTAVADALLQRVTEYLKNYDTLVIEVKELRQYKNQIIDLEKQLRKVVEEKDRILKIHNEQLKRGQFTGSEELVKLARL